MNKTTNIDGNTSSSQFNLYFGKKIDDKGRIIFPTSYINDSLNIGKEVSLFMLKDQSKLPYIYCIPTSGLIKILEKNKKNIKDFYPIMKKTSVDNQNRISLGKFLAFEYLEVDDKKREILLFGYGDYIAIYSKLNGEKLLNTLYSSLTF